MLSTVTEPLRVLQREKVAMEGIQRFASEKIKLDIGGTTFATTLTTLTSEPVDALCDFQACSVVHMLLCSVVQMLLSSAVLIYSPP